MSARSMVAILYVAIAASLAATWAGVPDVVVRSAGFAVAVYGGFVLGVLWGHRGDGGDVTLPTDPPPTDWAEFDALRQLWDRRPTGTRR